MTFGSSGDPAKEAAALRERLSRLSEASLRINESLDLDTVLQGVLDSARDLASARYGVLAVLDGARSGGKLLLASGLPPDEFRGPCRRYPAERSSSGTLGSLTAPLRVADFAVHAPFPWACPSFVRR